jgi:hypothetical protein
MNAYMSEWESHARFFLEYRMTIPTAGAYAFWARTAAMWDGKGTRTPCRWRIDDGPWTEQAEGSGECSGIELYAGTIHIGWVRFAPPVQGFDCFALTQGNLTLKGAGKPVGATDPVVPGVKQETIEPEWIAPPKGDPGVFTDENTWPFEYKENAFDNALLDLRSLNEKVAGEHGFVRMSLDGNSFVLGDGTPVRFWACVFDPVLGHLSPAEQRASITDEQLAEQARWLAKMGVNMVRLHMSLPSREAGSKVTHASDNEIAVIHRIVAAMKKEGIYTTISPYWPDSWFMRQTDITQWGIEGYTGRFGTDPDAAAPWGIAMFNPRLQEGFRAWLTALYTKRNPHTGVPLKDEPAVGIVQIQNEDSLLFWTMQGIRPEQKRIFNTQFGAWAAKKYGGLEKALAAWGGDKKKGDDPAAGVLEVSPIWSAINPGAPGDRATASYTFLVETNKAFYDMMYCHLRKIGCKQVINGGNWIPANITVQMDAEKYSYTGTDIVGNNRYFGLGHKRNRQVARYNKGDDYVFASMLKSPEKLPVSAKHVEGKGYIIPESGPFPPNPYLSEGPFLIGAYGALNDTDGYYWFLVMEKDIEYPREGSYPSPFENMFLVQQPMLMGMFPAAALIYRQGLIAHGDPVIRERRAMQDIHTRQVPVIESFEGADGNRDNQKLMTLPPMQMGEKSAHPLAFLTGEVRVSYGADKSSVERHDLGKLIDVASKTVTSATGELTWSYGKGICLMNAPRAQGVSGFLSRQGVFKLADSTISSKDEYASYWLVSMDSKPLTASGKILLQVGTLSQPTGWATLPLADVKDGQGKSWGPGVKLVGNLKWPWRIVKARAEVTLVNATVTKMKVLDGSERLREERPLERDGATVTFTVPDDALHCILE